MQCIGAEKLNDESIGYELIGIINNVGVVVTVGYYYGVSKSMEPGKREKI